MAFDPQYQPFPVDIGHLALGACGLSIEGTPMGHFHDAGFTIDTTTKVIKSGYPMRPVCVIIDSVSSKMYVSLDEIGATPVISLLSEILNSLNNDAPPPTKDVVMEVFRPRGANVFVTFTDAVLLQQFDLTLGNDFNQVKIEFESAFPNGMPLSNQINFSDTGPATYTAVSWLLSCGNISVGLPKITVGGGATGSLQSANIRLTTNYKRIEPGYPKVLRALVPLDYSLDIEFVSEEFTAAALALQLTPGSSTTVKIEIPTYDGGVVTIDVPSAVFIGGGPQIKQEDWSGINWKYMALAPSGVIATIT